jgi:beta-lactamase regulating signal transducer with metallopeptidase domain
LLHVMRRDALVHGLALLARSLFWPNPLAWSVVRALAREREILADAGVVGCLGRRADDAEGLLCVLEALQRPSPAQALFPGVSLGGQRSLRDRLEMVITGGGRSWEELSQCGRIAITTVMAGVLFLAPC